MLVPPLLALTREDYHVLLKIDEGIDTRPLQGDDLEEFVGNNFVLCNGFGRLEVPVPSPIYIDTP